MALVTNEQNEKRQSMFLKLIDKNKVVLQSNVYIIASHFVKSINRTIACYGEDCKLDHNENQPRKEYYYLGIINDEPGVLRLPASVFFGMNEIEHATGKDKRSISWLVIGSGAGLDRRYTVSKDENLTKDELTYDLEKNNQKLETVMAKYETTIEDKYQEFEVEGDN